MSLCLVLHSSLSPNPKISILNPYLHFRPSFSRCPSLSATIAAIRYLTPGKANAPRVMRCLSLSATTQAAAPMRKSTSPRSETLACPCRFSGLRYRGTIGTLPLRRDPADNEQGTRAEMPWGKEASPAEETLVAR